MSKHALLVLIAGSGLGLAAHWMPAAPPSGGAPATIQDAATRQAMTVLAEGLSGAKKAVEAGDRAALTTALATLLRGATSTHAATKDRAALAHHADSLHQLVAALAGTDSADFDHLASGLEEVRRSCVECHAAAGRSAQAGHLYPARATLIQGRIHLEDEGGNRRSDASGVVVFLDGVPSPQVGQPFLEPSIRQAGRQFSPRVLPIVRGTQVHFPNDDNIFHNVFSLSKCCQFDLDAYGGGNSKSVRFEKPGLVSVYCNIHPEMTASVLVLNNPWFAVTNKAGDFMIGEVPPGDYKLRTWSALGAEHRGDLKVGDRSTQRTELKLRESVRRRPAHVNKFGRSYRRKY